MGFVLTLISPARAEDDTSVLITTNYNNAAAAYFVGQMGSNNTLTISGGGVLTNVGTSYIGSNDIANANVAIVADPGSGWFSSNRLYIGSYGSGNSLMVTNGARVRNNMGLLGYSTSATANAATVTGPGSRWDNASTLYVGVFGSGNSLMIANSGLVSSLGTVLGDSSTANSNRVTVTGAGSTWSNNGTFYIGNSSGASWNSLLITNGGVMNNYNTAYISSGINSSNNSVIVTGAGSTWGIRGSLFHGNNGSGNSLAIADGGLVYINSDLYVGYNPSSSNNTITVTGPGSVMSNKTFTVGFNGAGNSLVISNGGRAYTYNGNSTIGNNSAGAASNSVIVTGAGSLWATTNMVAIGFAGCGNTLSVLDGATVSDFEGRIGSSPTATNNSVLVMGSGSVWSNSGALFIGHQGKGNTLVISNGGGVYSAAGILGYNNNSSNSVIVSGSGSTWSISGSLTNGLGSAWSSLGIVDGGAVSANNALMGALASSTNNQFVVSGGNLVLTNTAGSGGLEVRRGTLTFNGGTLMADRLVATNGAKSAVSFNGGTMTLGGGGSLVSNGVAFTVGDGSAAATLKLAGGIHTFQNGARISANATLGGTGFVNSLSIANGGTLAPGFSPGVLGFSNLSLDAGAILNFEIADATSFDQILATNLTVSGAVTWKLSLGDAAIANNVILKLVDVGIYGGATTSGWLSLGGTNLLADGASFGLADIHGGTANFRISYFGGDGNDVTLVVNPIPEPGVAALLGVTALGLLARRRARAGT